MKKIVVILFCLSSAMATVFSYEKENRVTDLFLSDIESLALEEVDLPGVTITCSRSPMDGVGRCYKNYSYPWTPSCGYTGYQYDYCTYASWV